MPKDCWFADGTKKTCSVFGRILYDIEVGIVGVEYYFTHSAFLRFSEFIEIFVDLQFFIYKNRHGWKKWNKIMNCNDANFKVMDFVTKRRRSRKVWVVF